MDASGTTEVWRRPSERAQQRLGRLALRRLALALARGSWRVLPPLAAGLAAAIPILNSTIKAVHAGWVPAGDDGIIATRGWDVFTSHTPLVGQYSEAGLVLRHQIMHSPGPMLYWLISLPARFGSVTSIAVTMGIVNTLAIILCVALARRRGGLVLMVATAVGIALMCQSLPTESMHDIWNPAAGLFGFLALIFLGWSVACGDRRLLPLTALVASFVVQTHLMYAAGTAVVLAVAGAGLLRTQIAERRRPAPGSGPGRRGPRIWPWAVGALVVAAACWTAPAIDQIEHSPGNLSVIVRTAEHRGATLGGAVGWHAVVRSIGPRPWWLYVPASEWERKYDVRTTPSATDVDWTIAVLAGLVLAALAGGGLGRWDLAAAAVIGLGLCGAIALQAASNPSTPLLAETLGYTMWWGSELGFWVWLVLAWAAWLGATAGLRLAARAAGATWSRRRAGSGGAAALAQRLGRLRTTRGAARARVAAIGLALVASIAGVAAVGSAVADTAKPDSHLYEYRSIHSLAGDIERLVPGGVAIDYRFGPLDTGSQPMEPAIRFLLVRHRDRVLAPGSLPRLGPYYELYGRPVQWIVDVRDGVRAPQPHMTFAGRVAFSDPWGRDVVSAWVMRVGAQPHRP